MSETERLKTLGHTKAKQNRRNRSGSRAQLSLPRPFDNQTGKPVNWGVGVKDGGAGCWKSHNRDVAIMVEKCR